MNDARCVEDENHIETISEPEEKLDRWRRTIAFFIGPFAFLLIWFLPFPHLPPQARALSAVLGLVLVYWVGEPVPLPVTAMLGPLLCVILGVDSAKAVFAPFSHPIIFLFIGSFMLAQAMKVHKLDYRLSIWVLSRPWVGNSYFRLFVATTLIPAAISMWISDSATTAMIFPVTVAICEMVGSLTQGAGSRFNTGLLLAIAYAALIGGIGTPIGTPPNLIGIGMLDKLANLKIPFYLWMQLAVPIMLVMLALMVTLLYALHRPPAKEIAGLSKFIALRQGELGAWTRGQKNVFIAFSLAIFLWVLPGVAATLFGTSSDFYKWLDAHLREESVSLIAAILLFLMPVDWGKREFTLAWKDAARIDWGTILLFGGGLALGGLIFSTGLADVMGRVIIETTGVSSVWGITALATGLAIIITEVTSNTATANMLVPLIISVADTAGVSPAPPAIGVCLGASMAFMLPVSTPSNAIVYGSRRVPVGSMIRAGILLDAASFFVINIGLRLLCPLLGLA